MEVLFSDCQCVILLNISDHLASTADIESDENIVSYDLIFCLSCLQNHWLDDFGLIDLIKWEQAVIFEYILTTTYLFWVHKVNPEVNTMVGYNLKFENWTNFV